MFLGFTVEEWVSLTIISLTLTPIVGHYVFGWPWVGDVVEDALHRVFRR